MTIYLTPWPPTNPEYFKIMAIRNGTGSRGRDEQVGSICTQGQVDRMARDQHAILVVDKDLLPLVIAEEDG